MWVVFVISNLFEIISTYIVGLAGPNDWKTS